MSRQPRQYDRRGFNNPRAVVTPDQVKRIRKLRGEGRTLAELAYVFGIGTSQVHRIIKGLSWKDSA